MKNVRYLNLPRLRIVKPEHEVNKDKFVKALHLMVAKGYLTKEEILEAVEEYKRMLN